MNDEQTGKPIEWKRSYPEWHHRYGKFDIKNKDGINPFFGEFFELLCFYKMFSVSFFSQIIVNKLIDRDNTDYWFMFTDLMMRIQCIEVHQGLSVNGACIEFIN